MKKRKLRAFSIIPLILAIILGAFSGYEVYQNYNLKITKEGLQKQSVSLSSQIQSLTENNQVLADKNRTLTDDNKNLTEKNKELSSTVASQKSENEDLQNKLKSNSPNTSCSSKNTSSKVSSKTVDGKKVAYLTFDDGPSNLTPGLLNILKENDVKATFFVIADSEDTAAKRSIMKKIVEGGHTIGIHSYSHKYSYIYKNEDNYFSDLNRMKKIIIEATGVTPKFIRFPGGTDNTVSFRYHGGTQIMQTLLNDVTEQGYTAVDWNVGGMDAVIPVPSTNTIVNGVVSECSSRNKAVILLHDSGTHKTSVNAVGQIIKKLKTMGFTFKAITKPEETYIRKPATKR